jgi:hypothetical protein
MMQIFIPGNERTILISQLTANTTADLDVTVVTVCMLQAGIEIHQATVDTLLVGRSRLTIYVLSNSYIHISTGE